MGDKEIQDDVKVVGGLFDKGKLPVLIVATALTLGACGQSSDGFYRSFLPPPEVEQTQEQEPEQVSKQRSRQLLKLDTAENDIKKPARIEIASIAAQTHPATQRIERLSREVLAILSNSAITKAQRKTQFGKLLARDLDIPLIGRFVMSKHWQRASEEQRATYMKVFRNYVVHTYSARLGGAEVDKFSVINTKAIGKKDILVRSKIVNANLEPLRADWRLRQSDGAYRILDLSVGGISMALTLRQEFGAILRKQGGVDNLIDLLKKRNA